MENESRARSPMPADALPLIGVGRGYAMLEGLRIIDLTTSIAGPFATMLLADMGAEVIKIERPEGGDDTRAWGPPFLDGEALWFASVNRNKKSVALDYSTQSGSDVLRGLISVADMVVVNLPPRVARKLKVDAKTLHAIRPDLVYVSITGFGLSGERADWTCYDLIAEGYSGIMDLTGASDSPPQKVGTPAADMLAGQDAAFAALAALYDRQRSGKGHVVDVALVDSMTRFLACRIMPYLGSGLVPTRTGGRDSVIAVYQAFETADEPITLALGNDNLWQRFWGAVGQPDQAHLAGVGSNSERRERREEIVGLIASILRTKPRAHWLDLFRAARVPAGPINRIDQVVTDATLRERGLFYRMTAADGRVLPQVGTGFLIDGVPNVPRSAPPKLGEHTHEIIDRILVAERSESRKETP